MKKCVDPISTLTQFKTYCSPNAFSKQDVASFFLSGIKTLAKVRLDYKELYKTLPPKPTVGQIYKPLSKMIDFGH